MTCVFGIDGGGTSSRLRVEDGEGKLLFYAEGASTNLNARDADAVRDTLAELFLQAEKQSGIGVAGYSAGYAGSAGVDREEDRGRFESLLRKATGYRGPLMVGNDAEPALAGALDDTEGILLIAGTGSIALGRSKDGYSVRAGGWGHLLGDEGSAWRIAFDAICRAIRSVEGRDLDTGLLEAALEHFGLERADDFIPFVYGNLDKTRVARFARVVGTYRDRRDPLALDIFDRAAKDLSQLVESVAVRIMPRLRRKRLAFRGGLIEGDATLRRETASRIASKIPALELVSPLADAAKGACLLARSLPG